MVKEARCGAAVGGGTPAVVVRDDQFMGYRTEGRVTNIASKIQNPVLGCNTNL